jgi:hypothetical protein
LLRPRLTHGFIWVQLIALELKVHIDTLSAISRLKTTTYGRLGRRLRLALMVKFVILLLKMNTLGLESLYQ